MEGHDQNSSNLSEEEEIMDLRRGPWTVEEDFTLINYIAHHGEGRWNSLARCAGLKRTGKSCRLRWLNYLRPDVRRGNITLEEQLLILELHSRWGNRWSKIAQHLPGRTDNEIKNYWRTRVQKHAKQLKCDVNSKQFKDTMRYLWMPRLLERIQAAAAAAAASPLPSSSSSSSSATTTTINAPQIMPQQPIHTINIIGLDHHTPDYSSAAAASSESTFGTPVSDLTEYSCYNNHPISGNLQVSNYCADDQYYSLTSPAAPANYFNQGLDFNGGGEWMMDGGDDLWNVDDVWLLHQQFDYNSNV